MSKVKKKPAASKTRGKGRGKGRGAAKKQASGFSAAALFETVRDFSVRFWRALLAAGAVAAAAAAVLFWSGGYFGLMGERLSRMAGAGAVSAGFEVKRITVRGLSETAEQDLLAAVGPVIGSSIVHFDPHAARARVEEIGWVRAAAVSRLLPDTVHVSVREREPAAVWQLSGALHLIDQDGAVIREIGAYEYANLPLIVGAGAPGAASGMLYALRGQSDLWGRTSALIRVGERRWNLRTKSGVDIKFPEEGYAEAVVYLARLQETLALLDEPLEYVDLRNPDNFVYRVRGAPEEAIDAQSLSEPDGR